MQNIIAALVSALAFVFSSRQQVASLKEQIQQRDQIINDLHEAVTADDASVESSKQAAAEAKAKQEQAESDLANLQASIDEAKTKADELASQITNDSSIPLSVNADTGAVTPT